MQTRQTQRFWSHTLLMALVGALLVPATRAQADDEQEEAPKPVRLHQSQIHRAHIRPPYSRYRYCDHWSHFGRPYYYDPPDPYALQKLLAARAELGEGGLDLSVRPRKAVVHVDGEQRGQARKYDGVPDYLWLAEGEHEITLRYEGRVPQTHTVKIRKGELHKLKVRLERTDTGSKR